MCQGCHRLVPRVSLPPRGGVAEAEPRRRLMRWPTNTRHLPPWPLYRPCSCPPRGESRSRADDAPATSPPVVPLIVTHGTPRSPPPARLRAPPWSCRLPLKGGVILEACTRLPCPIPWQGVNHVPGLMCQGCHRLVPRVSLPPRGGVAEAEPFRRRLMRRGGQPIPATSPPCPSLQALQLPPPLEGESQKPSRQAKADAVGGGKRTPVVFRYQARPPSPAFCCRSAGFLW